MGKPAGVYLTLEAPNLAVPDEDYHREISEKLADHMEELLHENHLTGRDISVLVVGLGNRQVTPDALGPYVADNLCVTRHIVREYGKYAMGMERAQLVSAIVPGVMGQTGMETLEIVKGVVTETKPDLVDRSRCAGGTQQPQAEPDDPDCRYRIYPEIRSRKSSEWTDAGDIGGSGDRDRCADRCGRGNDRQRYDGKSDSGDGNVRDIKRRGRSIKNV